MLKVRPVEAVVVWSCARADVVDENSGEIERLAAFRVTVAREGQDSGGPTAAAAVIPESGTNALGQTRGDHGVPTTIRETHPLGVARDGVQETKDLSVARRSVAPTVTKSFDEFWAIGRVRVRSEETVDCCVASTHDIGGAGQSKFHEVVSLCRRPTAANASTMPSVP